MRTTVTLDSDTEAMVRERMQQRGLTFKQAVNDAIREGSRPRSASAFSTTAVDLGVPTVNLDRALSIAGELEDDELLRKVRAGK